MAQQAPSAFQRHNCHVLVVTEVGKRAALAECDRKGGDYEVTMPIVAPHRHCTYAAPTVMQARRMASRLDDQAEGKPADH